ncbi:contactin-6-like [Pristis pectinata]|uniref:contactin-6-like n=1 Tax=Pristis pectinata TaxID=685728 RepID=UPI00223D38CF|nr:contactin-6-like [Pristis pectinata]
MGPRLLGHPLLVSIHPYIPSLQLCIQLVSAPDQGSNFERVRLPARPSCCLRLLQLNQPAGDLGYRRLFRHQYDGGRFETQGDNCLAQRDVKDIGEYICRLVCAVPERTASALRSLFNLAEKTELPQSGCNAAGNAPEFGRRGFPATADSQGKMFTTTTPPGVGRWRERDGRGPGPGTRTVWWTLAVVGFGPKSPQRLEPKSGALDSVRILSGRMPKYLGAGTAKKKEVVGALGSSVLLDPEVKADPNKDEIIWTFIASRRSPLTILHHIPGYKWAEPSEQFKSWLQFILANGSLIVNGLELGDQGDYSFMVADKELKIIQLLLFDELSEALISTNSSSLGSTVQLTCNVSGDPHEYRWWKDGGEISRHHWLMDGNRTLVIPKALGHDCGTYTCAATNPVGSIQADYTLIISGFPPEDIAIVTLSITELVISALSFIVFVAVRCWMMESDKAKKSQKCWLLTISDIVSRVAILIALVNWIIVKGASPISVMALCTDSVLLLALILPFVQKLGCLSTDCCRKNGVWDWAVGGLHLAVIIISVISLTVIHPNNLGCDSSLFTGRVFFATRIGCALICLLYFVVPHCRNKDTGGNVNTAKGQQLCC